MAGRTPSSRRTLLLASAVAAVAAATVVAAWPARSGPRGPAEPEGNTETASGSHSEVAAPRDAVPAHASSSDIPSVPQAPSSHAEEATIASGLVRGRLVDAAGEPVSELPVFLVAARGIEPRRTTSDVGGSFGFASVPDGTWNVALGGAEHPIVPHLAAQVSGGEVDLGDLALPPLGELEVLVVDDGERPVPSIDVTGRGTRGGTVDARTDATGRALARFLPAGEIRVFANDPALGRGNTIVELPSGGRATAKISLRRKP
jgi:hypothetical protein